MEAITSRRNPVVAQFRRVSRLSTPTDSTVLLDGPRLIEEARRAGVRIDLLAVSTAKAVARRTAAIVDRLDSSTRVVRVSPSVMAALSPVSTPSGLTALATRRPAHLEDTADTPRPLVVGLSGVQDPGNTGAVIRAVEAGGASGVVTVGGADPYGWKALRGAMGSTFRLPVVRSPDPDPVRREARVRGLRVMAAVPHGGTRLTETDLGNPCLVWLGAEGHGLATDLVETADEVITIPMHTPVSSLNIAVAAALIIYEAARQRGGVTPVAATRARTRRRSA